MAEIPWVDVEPLAYAAIALGVTYLVGQIIRGVLDRFFERTPLPETVERVGVALAVYAVYTVGILTALSLLGVDLTSVVVGMGAFSIAASFALSNVIQNLVSGILVIADRVFKVGDEIRVQSYEGRVVKISVRTTTIETKEGDIVSIPNTIFMTNPVTKKMAEAGNDNQSESEKQ